MAAAYDILIGGGIAGLSAAAALSGHAKVAVLEAEEQIGFHSSGRSATMLHYALGDRLVRALTLASRGFFDDPPDDFTEVPIGRPMPVLIHAREKVRKSLTAFRLTPLLTGSGGFQFASVLQPLLRAMSLDAPASANHAKPPPRRTSFATHGRRGEMALHRVTLVTFRDV